MLIINKLIYRRFCSLCIMFFLFIIRSYLKMYWWFLLLFIKEMQVWKQTFFIFMASSVLWKQALKLDSLTGNEITDSQEEEELKK